jgi:AhpD family alkylhydroperoxidase
MRKPIFASFLLATTELAAQADEPPQWIQQVFTGQELQAAREEVRTVYPDPDAALDAKTKQLIALAVAAQIPRQYCTPGYTTPTQKAGASDPQLQEAVALAAQVRKLSTMLNGLQYDMDKFRTEVGVPAASN